MILDPAGTAEIEGTKAPSSKTGRQRMVWERKGVGGLEEDAEMRGAIER